MTHADERDANYVSDFELIREFHEKFGLEYNESPRDLDDDLILFRIGFLIEELAEYAEASGFKVLAETLQSEIIEPLKSPDWNLSERSDDRDMEKQLDSLVDLNYVSHGTAYLHGFNFDEAFRRVHEANMNKVRVDSETLEGSVRKSKFDVVKPDDWTPADLSDLVAGKPDDTASKEYTGII